MPSVESLAVNLLEQELALYASPALERVQELVHLYCTAIEVYEKQKNPQHSFFQSKIQDLLLKPRVQQILAEHRPPSSSSETPAERLLGISAARVHRAAARTKLSLDTQEQALEQKRAVRIRRRSWRTRRSES